MDEKRRKKILLFIRRNKLDESTIYLIDQALTHKSYANEQSATRHAPKLNEYNQRLEFLGDAILGMIIAKAFYLEFPNNNEGDLTRKKARAVCEATLADIGNHIGIGRVIQMGKGEVNTKGFERKSCIGDALESLIGAVYLNNGYDACEKFVLSLWNPYIKHDKVVLDSIDYKSKLQEYIIRSKKIRPEYKVLSIGGPEHEREYTIGLLIEGKQLSSATAKSKKKAEQQAAEHYMKQLHLKV